MNKVGVSIIEDSEIHIEWLKTELSEDPKFEIVSIDNLGRKGIESIRHHKPAMVLLDFQLKDMTGLEISKRIKTYEENIKIFSLTAHTEVSIIERIINDSSIDAIAIKGSHYFEDNFISALRHVNEGGTYLAPSLLKKFREVKNLNGFTLCAPFK